MDNDTDQGRCRIAEVVQYMCDMQKASSSSEIVCVPFPRLFRLCPGQPATEITTIANINLETGEVELPTNANIRSKIKGKEWKKVTRHEDNINFPSGW
ncbi:hypothetical protein AX14_013482 [Amanita brunnescens Koide BX004]|nr:hypothetical protein AX14_013482 [Amanita brunnescens Koide BX004]